MNAQSMTFDVSKKPGVIPDDKHYCSVNGTETVIEGEHDDELGFAPLSLDYQALIAPLVPYAQSPESRIEQLEARVTALEGDAS